VHWVTPTTATLTAGGIALVYAVVVLWAMRWYFVRDGSARREALLVQLSAAGGTLLFWAAFLLSGGAADWPRWVGAGVLAAATGLFGWALYSHDRTPLPFAFSAVTPPKLVTAGPYRFVRHPVYSAYLLGWAGGVFAAANPWLLLVVVWFAGLYTWAARREERVLLAGPLADAYRQYRRSAGTFLPTIRG
jgi:protein-S-isoprenylcysteine O-methyltransferase Ste14